MCCCEQRLVSVGQQIQRDLQLQQERLQRRRQLLAKAQLAAALLVGQPGDGHSHGFHDAADALRQSRLSAEAVQVRCMGKSMSCILNLRSSHTKEICTTHCACPLPCTQWSIPCDLQASCGHLHDTKAAQQSHVAHGTMHACRHGHTLGSSLVSARRSCYLRR